MYVLHFILCLFMEKRKWKKNTKTGPKEGIDTVHHASCIVFACSRYDRLEKLLLYNSSFFCMKKDGRIIGWDSSAVLIELGV